MSSEKVICFTDSRGNPLFSLPDSSFLCLEYGNGDSSCAFCRYHSEEQVEIDGKCRNIRQFAKQMEKNGIRKTGCLSCALPAGISVCLLMNRS